MFLFAENCYKSNNYLSYWFITTHRVTLGNKFWVSFKGYDKDEEHTITEYLNQNGEKEPPRDTESKSFISQ